MRDGFKVGFSTLYFPSTCAQTLPKHLLQQSRCGPKGLSHTLPGLKSWKDLRNTNSITGYYVNWILPPSDLPSLNQKPNYHTGTKSFCLEWFWLNAASGMADIIYCIGCTQMRLVAFQVASRSLNLLVWMDMRSDKSLRLTPLSHWQPCRRPGGRQSAQLPLLHHPLIT